eukprot:gene8976-6299_t
MSTSPLVDLQLVGRNVTAQTVDLTVHPLPQLLPAPRNGEAQQRLLAETLHYIAVSLGPDTAVGGQQPSHPGEHRLLLLEKARQLTTYHYCGPRPIRAVSFVNFISNTGASATDYEVDIWTVKDAAGGGPDSPRLACEVIVKLSLTPSPNPICNVAFFIDSAVEAPNLFLLRRHDASLVLSAAHIKSNSGTCMKLDSNYDVKRIRYFGPNPSDNPNSNDDGATAAATTGSSRACAISATGFFAFQVDATSGIVCTSANPSTPRWSCCRGEVVRDLLFVPSPGGTGPTVLLAASENNVFEWRLSATSEPHLHRQFTFGSHMITGVDVSTGVVAIFNNKKQVALIENISGRPGSNHSSHRAGAGAGPSQELVVTLYNLPQQLPSFHRISFHRTKHGCNVYAATDVLLECVQWPHAPAQAQAPVPASASAPAPQEAGGSSVLANFFHSTGAAQISSNNSTNGKTSTGGTTITTTSSSTASAGGSRPGLPSIANMMSETKQRREELSALQQIQPQPQHPVAMKAAAAAAAHVMNLTLPQQVEMGELSAAAARSRLLVREGFEPLLNKVQNIVDIQDLTKKQLEEGSKKLISLSLEAQMAELQEFARQEMKRHGGGAVGSSSTGATAGSMAAMLGARIAPGGPTETQRANDDAFRSYLLSSILSSTSEIITGIDDGIQTVLSRQMQRIADEGIKKALRQNQRAAIQRRLDELLESSSSSVQIRLRKSLDQLKEDVRAESERGRSAFQALQRENEDLRRIILRLTSNGSFEELESLRREIHTLKRTVETLQASGGVAGCLPPQRNAPSVLDTALQLFREQENTVAALQHLVTAADPLLATEFMVQLSPEEFDTLVVSSAPVELWSTFVRQLSRAGLAMLHNVNATAPSQVQQGMKQVLDTIEAIFTEQSSVTDVVTSKSSPSVATAKKDMRDTLLAFLHRVEECCTNDPISDALRSSAKGLHAFILSNAQPYPEGRRKENVVLVSNSCKLIRQTNKQTKTNKNANSRQNSMEMKAEQRDVEMKSVHKQKEGEYNIKTNNNYLAAGRWLSRRNGVADMREKKRKEKTYFYGSFHAVRGNPTPHPHPPPTLKKEKEKNNNKTLLPSHYESSRLDYALARILVSRDSSNSSSIPNKSAAWEEINKWPLNILHPNSQKLGETCKHIFYRRRPSSSSSCRQNETSLDSLHKSPIGSDTDRHSFSFSFFFFCFGSFHVTQRILNLFSPSSSTFFFYYSRQVQPAFPSKSQKFVCHLTFAKADGNDFLSPPLPLFSFIIILTSYFSLFVVGGRRLSSPLLGFYIHTYIYIVLPFPCISFHLPTLPFVLCGVASCVLNPCCRSREIETLKRQKKRERERRRMYRRHVLGASGCTGVLKIARSVPARHTTRPSSIAAATQAGRSPRLLSSSSSRSVVASTAVLTSMRFCSAGVPLHTTAALLLLQRGSNSTPISNIPPHRPSNAVPASAPPTRSSVGVVSEAGSKRVKITKVRRTIRRKRSSSSATPSLSHARPTAPPSSAPGGRSPMTAAMDVDSDHAEVDFAGVQDAQIDESLGTDAAYEMGVEAAYPPSIAADVRARTSHPHAGAPAPPPLPLQQQGEGGRSSFQLWDVAAADDDLKGLESGRPDELAEVQMEEEEILEFCEEVGQEPAEGDTATATAAATAGPPRPSERATSPSRGAAAAAQAQASFTPRGGTAGAAGSVPLPVTAAGSSAAALLAFESPLNLRLATLTRQAGKAFRTVVVHFPLQRGGAMDFELSFEDVASASRLVCKLSEVKTLYFDWLAQFRSTFVALFLPTLHHPSAVLLQHAVLNGRPPRASPPSSGGGGGRAPSERLEDDADHLLFSFQRLQDTVVAKHDKVRESLAAENSADVAAVAKPPANADGSVSIPLLAVTILNTTPEEWQAFITSSLSCAPQDFVLAAFNFRPAAQTSLTATLNKDLLLAQLSAAARTALFYASSSRPSPSTAAHTLRGSGDATDDFTCLPTAIAASMPVRPGAASTSASWKLVFVSAPGKMANVPPPMQDLLTGQFVEPLTLSGQHVLYIIGTGNACLAFHQLPTARKGQHAISILLQDIEAQLGLHRPHHVSLTAVLTQALESFSRLTWMGLMELECGQLRAPKPPSYFYRLKRRSVPREVVPSFLEEVFGGVRSGGGGAGQWRGGSPLQHGGGRAAMMVGGDPNAHHRPVPKDVEVYFSGIFNNADRLAREQALRDDLQQCRGYLIHLHTAAVTAARRSDNPFSNRNGIQEAWVQRWEKIGSSAAPPVTKHYRSKGGSSSAPVFLVPDDMLPADFPVQPDTHPDPATHASKAILIAWDAKRTLLFLRSSRRLREFLFNGGRIWCAQYAQYLLRGFDHHHLATMERTWAMSSDPSRPAPTKPLSPVGKLKVILDAQLQLAVHGRQLVSMVKRMDGLLATAEMENNGLRVVPQQKVSAFAHQLASEHKELERVLQHKISDFTRGLDDSVRARINYRSPQEISTLIYGGGFCRYLASRFVPVRPSKHPITSLFPHFVCHCTSTPVPPMYTEAETLLGSFSNAAVKSTVTGFQFTKRQVDDAVQTIQLCCRTHLPRSRGGVLQQLLANTAIVVLVCKASMGGILERVSLYCPTVANSNSHTTTTTTDNNNTNNNGTMTAADEEEPSGAAPASQSTELRVRVAVDEAIPANTPAGQDPLLTVTQLKQAIRDHPPLQALRNALHQKTPRNIKAIHNLLILTDCTHERLEVLVDTGVVQTIQEVVLGAAPALPPSPAEAGRTAVADGARSSLFAPPVERVCFADLTKAAPPPPTAGDSFEADFSDLNARSSAAVCSARESWDALAKDHLTLGGMDGLLHNLVSHCASLVGTPRDPFKSSHPLPSVMPLGLHGQERASTQGMIWTVTPPNLHPILRRFLQGRSSNSSAEAIERVTVFLSPYRGIDLSFFTALQQLRFTEKKMQLFEEGCLFRAVLPECHDRVHGEFCHCVTATGRLSSQSPNLQNIPREEDLRRLFVSRFGTQDGRMIEADYSQLEVVVLASLSGDPRMTEEIKRKVDFHCLRVALMLKEPYESVEHKVKKLRDPHYIQLRQQAKTFSFQRQYGAGVATISTTTGLTESEVDSLIAAEDSHYVGLGTYYRLVENTVDAGNERLLRLRQLDPALPTHLRRVMLLTCPKNYFVVPTGSKFDLRKDRKSGPRLKNYPVQGLAGEIVQVMCGELVRHFFQRRNYGNKAFLVNTVHDCVWVDAHKDVAEVVKKDIAALMRSTQERLRAIWPDVSFDVPFNAAIQSGPSLGQLASD